MKKYYIGGSIGQLVALFICFAMLGFLFGFLLKQTITTGDVESIVAAIGVGIIGLGFLAFVIFCLISYIRMNLALKGKKDFGIVKEAYISSGRGASFHLTVTYTNELGVECVFFSSLKGDLMKRFNEGAKVPIRLNGKYAYVDIEEMDRLIEENKGNCCPVCKELLDGTESFCKICGYKIK